MTSTGNPPETFRALRSAVPFLLLLPLLFPVPAPAGEWRVSPIRLDLGRDAKSGAVTVVNEADGRLQVQMNAVEWTQDAEGKDRYAETGDILFFPRMMIFEKREEKILRVGIKAPAATAEKAYRLFIEEIPGPGKSQGTNIAIAIRFGVPIFVHPPKEEARGEIGEVSMSGGTLSIPVKNGGNVHFVIQSLLVRGKDGSGKEIFSREIGGWYLLAGASRLYTTAIPTDICGSLSGVDVEVRTDKLPLRGQLVADPSMCTEK
jgi:fimbrial chaperone protein